MLQYSESWELRTSLLINWLILIPAFPILIYSLYQSIIQKIFHKNTQVQIVIHLVALLIHCTGRWAYHFSYQLSLSIQICSPLSGPLELLQNLSKWL